MPLPSATATLPAVAAPTPTVGATKVPGVNQLVNPCFDGDHSFPPDHWQQVGGWDVSMYKNPCGPNKTAARMNDLEMRGEAQPGVEGRIWQIVPGQGPNLVAEMMGVYHEPTDHADLNIYGGDSAEGPWSLVWTPFTKADLAKDRWGTAVQRAETALAQAYAYYKVEFAGMYLSADGGIKFTNAYFESSE